MNTKSPKNSNENPYAILAENTNFATPKYENQLIEGFTY